MLKIGLGPPRRGSFTEPATISGSAATVEAIGFDSLWMGDRALAPTRPCDPRSSWTSWNTSGPGLRMSTGGRCGRSRVRTSNCSVLQISDHLMATHAAGADEVFIDLQLTARSVEELTDLTYRLHEPLRKG